MQDPSNKPAIIELEGIRKDYRMGDSTVRAIRNVDLRIQAGEYIAITGTSGSGKSSLLHIIGCLDSQTDGQYSLDGINLKKLPDEKLSEIRNHMIGFVFQSYYLMPQFNVVENIEFPLLYRGVDRRHRGELVDKALRKVGLVERRDHKSHQLSGGERQRVAIARALVGKPKILLADEPTGNLDQENGQEIMDYFEKFNKEGVTIIMVTHDMEKAAQAHKVYEMRDGRLLC